MTPTAKRVFAYLVDVEKGLSMDPNDRGNWTGGRVGVGELRGTNYGISAAAHPTLWIAALSLEDAQALFEGEYWNAIQGDQLPYPLALCLADDAYNHGVDLAVRTLQHVLGVIVDGKMGSKTTARAKAADTYTTVVSFQAARAMEYAQDPNVARYGADWFRERVLGTTLAALIPGGIRGAQSSD